VTGQKDGGKGVFRFGSVSGGETEREKRRLRRQKLESDIARPSNVFSFVNDTHPTSAQLLDDSVVGDGLTDERVGFRHLEDILAPATALPVVAARRRVNETTRIAGWFEHKKRQVCVKRASLEPPRLVDSRLHILARRVHVVEVLLRNF
jgi:hypothetical protein